MHHSNYLRIFYLLKKYLRLANEELLVIIYNLHFKKKGLK